MRTFVVAAVLVALALSGCSAQPGVALPPTDAVVDYQLGGGYDPGPGVGGVVRDSTDVPAAGLYSVCYINGFQSQPADRAIWLEQRAALVLRRDGVPVVDENWPDELIFDTSTPANRAEIARLLDPVFARCADRGFDAVEIDNLDSYTRSGGALDEDDALELARLFVHAAHGRSLAIAQKNAAELVSRGRDAGFDFAVAEECRRFDECDLYTAVYGVIIDIEYADDLGGSVAELCADPQIPASTIVRDRDLVTPSRPGYEFESC